MLIPNCLLKAHNDELVTEKDAALKAAEYWKSQYLELEELLNKYSDD